MQLGSPIDAVAAATFHAAHIAFSDVHYLTRDWAALEGLSMDERRKIQLDDYPMLNKVRRPNISEIQVTAMFPQTWGSTALGFGGIAAALLGMMADSYGVEAVYVICSFLPLAGLMTWFLPRIDEGKGG